PRISEALPPAANTHRSNQLQSLRNEMNALLGMLSRPIGTSAPAKVKSMRPRLTLEPRPTPVAVDADQPAETHKPTLLKLAQRDLFGSDEPGPETTA
ncbi:MAG: hypothetical protein ABI142_12150, partial [Bryocella sp.]